MPCCARLRTTQEGSSGFNSNPIIDESELQMRNRSILEQHEDSHRHYLALCDEMKRCLEKIGFVGNVPTPVVLVYDINASDNATYRLRQPNTPPMQQNVFFLELRFGGRDCPIWIAGMNAHPPGNGVGSFVLTKLTEIADAHDLKIALSSSPESSWRAKHDAWLKRLGFKQLPFDKRSGDESHVREPYGKGGGLLAKMCLLLRRH